MAQNRDFIFGAGVDFADWSGDMRRLASDLDKAESDFKAAADAANNMERAVNNIDGSVNVNATVNDADLRTAVGLRDDLNANTSMVAGADESELDAAKRIHDDLGANVDTNVNVNDSELAGVKRELETLNALATIEVTLTVANLATGLLSDPNSLPVVGGLLEMDSALQELEGRTGRMIPDAERLIVDLYTNAWGESRTEIANVVTEASNLGLELDEIEEATRAAFLVMDQTGGDAQETLRTLDSLVKNNLASSFSEAADIITVGLQTGADRGDDLLDTFNEYGSTFDELRISGAGALGIINSGLRAGADNSDRIADALRETGIRLGEINTDPNIKKAFDRLDELSGVDLNSLFDAYNAGEITGDEFFGGFFQAFSDAAATNPQEADSLATVLIGTISEDFGLNVISELTPQWDEAMGELEGRAQTASDTINNNLSTLVTGLSRTVEQTIADIVTDTIDVEAVIEDAKTRLGVFAQELREGESITGAAAIALDIDPEAIARFESVIGNLAITLSTAIASALDLIGQGDAAEAVRASIAGAVEEQFVFDLKLADDGAAIQTAIETAAARGFDSEQVASGLQRAVDEMLGEGNTGAAGRFVNDLTSLLRPSIEDALNTLPEVGFENVLPNLQSLFGEGEVDLAEIVDTEALTTKVRETADDMVFQFNNAINKDDFELARTIAEGLDDPLLISFVDELEAQFVEMSRVAEEESAEIERELANMDTETSRSLDASASNMETWAQRTVNAGDDAIAMFQRIAFEASAAQIAAENSRLAAEGAPPPINGNAPSASGGYRGPGRTRVHEDGFEYISTDTSIAVLNAQTTDSLFSAVEQLLSHGIMGGDSVSHRSATVNQNFFVQSPAQAESAAYQTARQVRGF